MPEPISSTGPLPDACYDDEPSLQTSTPAPAVVVGAVSESETLECQNPEPNSCALPSAVKSLVDRFSPSNTPSFVAASPSPASPRELVLFENNAERTAVRFDNFSPYAAAGTTVDGKSVFAGAAALKTHLTTGALAGSEAEVLTASAQLGFQSELQVGVARAAYGATNFELAAARANVGFLNDDGSHGANVGVSLDIAGFEHTVSRSGWSLTTGLSEQLGGSASVGIRDADGDGNTELCVKVSVPALTLGVCVENPF